MRCLALASPSIGAPAAAQVASVSKQKPLKLSANFRERFHKIGRRPISGPSPLIQCLNCQTLVSKHTVVSQMLELS